MMADVAETTSSHVSGYDEQPHSFGTRWQLHLQQQPVYSCLRSSVILKTVANIPLMSATTSSCSDPQLQLPMVSSGQSHGHSTFNDVWRLSPLLSSRRCEILAWLSRCWSCRAQVMSREKERLDGMRSEHDFLHGDTDRCEGLWINNGCIITRRWILILLPRWVESVALTVKNKVFDNWRLLVSHVS